MDQTNTQNQTAVEDVPFIESVFYLTDFSIASDKAFEEKSVFGAWFGQPCRLILDGHRRTSVPAALIASHI